MDFLDKLLPSLCAGLFCSVLLYLWKRYSKNKKEAQHRVAMAFFFLVGFSLLVALATAQSVVAAIVGIAVGLGVPGLFLTRGEEDRAAAAAKKAKKLADRAGGEGEGSAAPSAVSALREGAQGLFHRPARKARGAVPRTAQELAEAVKGERAGSRLSVVGVPLPQGAEQRHIAVVTKSEGERQVLVGEVLEQLHAAGDTVIVLDRGGELLSRHFHEDSDFVFNPNDHRCVSWSPLLDMRTADDCDAFAHQLVAGEPSHPCDPGAVRVFTSALCRYLLARGRLTMRDLLFCVESAQVSELTLMLKGTAASEHIKSEATLEAVRASFGTYLQAFSELPLDRSPFSLREMIAHQHSGILFVTYHDDDLVRPGGAVRSLVDFACLAVTDSDVDSGRVWLVLPRIGALGPVRSLPAYVQSGSGGRLLAGVDADGLVSAGLPLAGDSAASHFGTWLVSGATDERTAQMLQATFAQQATDVSLLPTPAEFTGLSDSQGFVLIPDFPPCSLERSPGTPRAKTTEAFETRDHSKRPGAAAQPQEEPVLRRRLHPEIAPLQMPVAAVEQPRSTSNREEPPANTSLEEARPVPPQTAASERSVEEAAPVAEPPSSKPSTADLLGALRPSARPARVAPAAAPSDAQRKPAAAPATPAAPKEPQADALAGLLKKPAASKQTKKPAEGPTSKQVEPRAPERQAAPQPAPRKPEAAEPREASKARQPLEPVAPRADESLPKLPADSKVLVARASAPASKPAAPAREPVPAAAKPKPEVPDVPADCSVLVYRA